MTAKWQDSELLQSCVRAHGRNQLALRVGGRVRAGCSKEELCWLSLEAGVGETALGRGHRSVKAWENWGLRYI